MDWRDIPVGMVRHEELLNALLALWKMQYNHGSRDSTEFSRGYVTGFEEGLEAIAQITGLIESFETGKAMHCTKIGTKLEPRLALIEGQLALVDTGQSTLHECDRP